MPSNDTLLKLLMLIGIVLGLLFIVFSILGLIERAS